jgi:hypothetical protein
MEEDKIVDTTRHIMLRLVTNDNIIGRLVSETENEFLLEFPMQAMVIEGFDMSTRLYFNPVNPFEPTRTQFLFRKIHVVFDGTISDNIKSYYEKNVDVRYLGKSVEKATPESVEDYDDDVYKEFLEKLKFSPDIKGN